MKGCSVGILTKGDEISDLNKLRLGGVCTLTKLVS